MHRQWILSRQRPQLRFLFLLAFLVIAPLSTHASLLNPASSLGATPSPYQNSYLWTAASGENYANEKSRFDPRIDLEWNSLSNSTVNGMHRSQLHFNFFFETSSLGDRSIDPDIAVWRYSLSNSTHMWIGRTHPLLEGFEGGKILSTSAVGNNWLQNQANALEPNVVGWIGIGAHSKIDSFFFTAAATPIYFPNFGPRTDLSEDAAANGSRFARLPPQYVRLNNTLLPLRFHIDTGKITNIIFQPQALLSFGWDTKPTLLRFSAWSSPTLSPEVDTNNLLRIQNSDVNVLITAKPKFPRENFLAFTAEEKISGMHSHFESVYETRTQRISVSQSISPLSFFSVGGLHTFYKPVAPDPSVPESPKYDKMLLWSELAAQDGKFRPGLRFEHHFTKFGEDNWLAAKARYMISNAFSLYSHISVLAGSDMSYFGTWRNLDSLRLGASYLW